MKPFLLGLTGSAGMGKSTTASLFVEAGIPVWDADATVHRLYEPKGGAVALLAKLWPDVVGGNGGVDRARLRAVVARDTSALRLLEQIVHPLVAADRAAFLASVATDLVVLDVPLLYETGAERDMDAVLVVTAPPALQLVRLQARPNYDEDQVAQLLARQLPDREKRARADHILETLSIASVRAGVEALIAYIRGPLCRGSSGSGAGG